MTDMIEELELALEKANEPKPHRQVKEWMAGRADDAACRQWQERVRAAELELLAALPQLLSLAKLGLLVREDGEEVVEKVARAILFPEFMECPEDASVAQWQALAVLRTLEGLVK